MLTRLKLRNFRQHASTMLEFVPGVNTIVGDNNSGKSTIPEAIEFAFYGSRALRDSARSFIRDGESDGAAIVELEMGKTYTVGRNSRNAEVRVDGVLDARYKDNVTAYVGGITGCNQTGFRLGHYVRQKELAAFSSLRPGKRHEQVEKMLKVNAVDVAIKRIKEEHNELDIRLKAMMSQYRDVDAVLNELDDVKMVLEGLHKRRSELEEDMVTLSAELERLNGLQVLQLKHEERERLRNKLDAVDLADQKLSEVLERLSDAGDVSTEALAALGTKLEALAEKEREHIRMQGIKEQLAKLPTVVPPVVVERPLQPDASAVQQIEQHIAVARKELAKDLPDDCPTCGQHVTPEYRAHVHDVWNEKLKEHQEALEIAQAALAERQGRYQSDERRYRDYLRTKADYDANESQRQRLVEQYVETAYDDAEKRGLAEELAELRKRRENWLTLDGERRRLEDMAGERSELEQRFMSLSIALGDYVPSQESNDLETIKSLHAERQAAIKVVISEAAYAEGRILELDRTYQTMTKLRQDIDIVAREAAKKKAMMDNFVLFKRHLTTKIHPMLQEVAEALFHRTTKNRYASYQIGSDYEITLTTHRGYIRKLSTVSGSENDLACLCLRLAIATLRSSKLAGALGFVILDEISGSFDDDRTRQTLEGLLELRDVIPQIINITHKPVEVKFADRLFTVKERNGIAEVTWVDN